MSTAEQQAKAPQDIRNVVSFLRSSKAGLKNRTGVLNGKRIDYYKGKSAVKALLSPSYAKLKNVPKVTSEAEAVALLHSMIPFAFFLRVDRGAPVGSASSPKHVQINQMQLFKPDEYYAWFYEGSQWTTYVGGITMVAVMLAGVMFPLWPPMLRLGVWYISIGVLGLIGLLFVIAIVRLIFYIITVIVASPGIWIFPRLFADVGFVRRLIYSFVGVDVPKKRARKERKGKSGKEKAAGSAENVNNGAYIEEVESESSRPGSRQATVEEVAEDDS